MKSVAFLQQIDRKKDNKINDKIKTEIRSTILSVTTEPMDIENFTLSVFVNT